MMGRASGVRDLPGAGHRRGAELMVWSEKMPRQVYAGRGSREDTPRRA